MIPRIPPPAQCRGRGLPWQMNTNFRRKASESETSRPVEKHNFTARHYASAACCHLVFVCPPVRPSVCLAQVGVEDSFSFAAFAAFGGSCAL